MKIGLGIILFFFASQMTVVVEAFSSWHNQIFLPSQMMARFGKPGINFLTHGGMWSDMFPLPLLLCFMLMYSAKWSLDRDWLPIALGIGITLANQILLSHPPRPDPLGSIDMKWSLAIAVHFVYMATYIAIIGHFYFNPEGVTVCDIIIVSVFLGLHVAAGTHVFLGVINLWTNWDWCPNPLADGGLPYMSATMWMLLAGLAWYSGGLTAGLTVAGTGVVLASVVVALAKLVPAN